LIFLSAAGRGAQALTVDGSLSGSIARTAALRYAFLLRNPTPKTVRDPLFITFAPEPEGAWHVRQAVHANARYRTDSDGPYRSMLRFDLGSLAPYESRRIQVDVEIGLLARERPGRSRDPSAFLRAETKLESDDDQIRRIALQLRAASARDSARAIFAWTRKNLRYAGYLSEARGAKRALSEGAGDCTEYAFLVVALSRAAGLPARVVSGFVINERTRLRATDYHDWAEIHVDGKWILADAQREVFEPQTNPLYVPFAVASEPGSSVKGTQRFIAQTPLIAELE
jgi:transglutaminase-like putative cysteine protease